MDYGSVVNDIAKAVMKKLVELDVHIREDFCVYYIKLLKLDPNWGIADDISYRQADFEKFVDHVTCSLQDQSPRLKTIKIQFHFETVTRSLDRFAADRRELLAAKLEPLRSLIMKDISRNSNLNRRSEQLVHYLTLASGLGNPLEPKVHKEVQTVFRSVIDRSELVELLKSEMDVRSNKLDMLIGTVAGIRLFNYSCMKGGEGIINLYELMRNSVRKIRRHIFASIFSRKVKREVSRLSAVLDNYYEPKNSKNRIVFACHLPSYATEADLDDIKLLLVMYTQFTKSMHKLLDEVDNLEDRLSMTEYSYNGLLDYLKENVKHEMIISGPKFFPIFRQLYEWWMCVQDEVVTLTALKIIFEEQFFMMQSTQFRNRLSTFLPDEALGKKICLEKCISHAEMLRMLGFKKGVKVHRKESFIDFRDLKLEYSGFCCWKLVSTDGMLSTGHPDHGVVEYQDKYYIFSCDIGLTCFVRDPEYYILHVLALGRKKCELIVMLSIRDLMKHYRHKKRIFEEEKHEVVTVASVNTDFIFPVGEFDKNYEWNVWEMRRKAIQMMKLKKCKTSSVQTVKSHYRNTISVETHPSRDQSVQTMLNNSTNTPKPSRYISGLRGKRDSRPFCLDLTLWDDVNSCKNKTIQ